MSPVRRASRVDAHDACFTTSTFSPYFLKSPSSWAITTDAQSVSAMNPMLIFSLLEAFGIETCVGPAVAPVNVATGDAGLLGPELSSPPQAARTPGTAAAAPAIP